MYKVCRFFIVDVFNTQNDNKVRCCLWVSTATRTHRGLGVILWLLSVVCCPAGCTTHYGGGQRVQAARCSGGYVTNRCRSSELGGSTSSSFPLASASISWTNTCALAATEISSNDTFSYSQRNHKKKSSNSYFQRSFMTTMR